MLKSKDKIFKNKGFTLIEIIIVIAIIGIVIGIASISLNALSVSKEQMFIEKFKTSISSIKNFSMNYNKQSKIVFDNKKKQVKYYYLDSTSDTWIINNKMPPLDIKGINILSDENNIIIKPNGFITRTMLTVFEDEQSISLEIK